MWQFPELFLMFLPVTRYKLTSQTPDIRFYRYFLRSGLWAWWAKLAYQVMLIIRGRLITPFILGSMSVGLNILIRHSFTELWVWITALVPWPQLLKREMSSFPVEAPIWPFDLKWACCCQYSYTIEFFHFDIFLFLRLEKCILKSNGL